MSLIFLGLGLFSPKAQGENAAFGPLSSREGEASEPRSFERGVFGGPAPVSGAPAGFSEDKAMLASNPLPDPAALSSDASGALAARNILQIAALQESSGPDASTNRNSGELRVDLASNTDVFDSKSYFILPTQGFNWGKLHPHNAVDIANSCGAPAVASAQGLVSDLFLDSWSGGYGHYVVLAHLNGTKTRYAHLDRIFVSLGQYVKQADLIGTVGRTGDATGCHVHFEVEGAANPFAR